MALNRPLSHNLPLLLSLVVLWLLPHQLLPRLWLLVLPLLLVPWLLQMVVPLLLLVQVLLPVLTPLQVARLLSLLWTLLEPLLVTLLLGLLPWDLLLLLEWWLLRLGLQAAHLRLPNHALREHLGSTHGVQDSMRLLQQVQVAAPCSLRCPLLAVAVQCACSWLALHLVHLRLLLLLLLLLPLLPLLPLLLPMPLLLRALHLL